MTQIRWTDQAIDDVRAIREFIERDSPRYGRLVAERIVNAVVRLETFPRLGRVVAELGRSDVREIILGEYRIVYRLDRDAGVLLHSISIVSAFPNGPRWPLTDRG